MRFKSFFFSLLLAFGFIAAGFSAVQAAEDGSAVKSVEVRGNRTVSSLTVLAKVKTQPGAPLSSTALNEDLKRLYGLGYFTDVRIEQEETADGVNVIFVVVEKPVLSNIEIVGNLKLKTGDIKKEMQSVLGDFVDQKRVRDDVEAVRKLYEKKGFSDAHIEHALDVNDQTGQATLRILVDEGQKMRIVDIRVEGNNSISAGKITKAMKTKKKAWFGWFHSGYLKQEELVEDVERVKALYDEEGFSDVEVTTRTEEIPNSGDLRLVVSVKEGQKYLVGGITLQGNSSVATTDEIMKVLKMASGKPFSRRGLRLDVSNIQDLYFEKGYLSAQIRSESLYNEQTQKVDINYSIVENELTYVDRVRVQGNTKTKDIVVRRELRAYPGESFSGAKLKRSKERLYNLGYFEDVRFDTEPGSTPNSRDLVVSVKEAKTGEFSFGGGYSSIDSVIGFVQIRQKNFDWQNWKTFTGAGQDLALRLELGSVRQNAELSFTEPWVFGHPYSFGFDIYRREFDRSGNSGYFFNQEKTGVNFRLGKEFNEYDKGLLQYRIEEVEISDIRDDASADLKAEVGTNVTSATSLTLTHDDRDNVYNPTRGVLLSGTGEYAGGPLGGDRDFWKLYGIASTYFKHFDVNVLEIKGRAGIADAHGDSEKVPIYERYFAGGANTIRGYRERRVGPRDAGNHEPIGGEAYWIFNAEETFPIYPDLIKGAVFYDVGNVFTSIEDFGDGGTFSGVGAGVRIKTPIGPVKLDMGYPLDDVDGEKKKLRFYFNISQGF